jgi:4-hydroxy-2-oxoheptanedioate aldolase
MTMQATNRLQKALRTERGLSFGAWQMLPGANHARLMARSGYDWICVDTEHGNIAGMLKCTWFNYLMYEY